MSQIFAHLFSCCIRTSKRRNNQNLDVPDENSRLIPTLDNDPTPSASPHVIIIDQQKLKDRLGTIVRAKEAKMVNVQAQIPFNLHNQPLSHSAHPSRLDLHYTSSSRSASASASMHRNSSGISPYTPISGNANGTTNLRNHVPPALRLHAHSAESSSRSESRSQSGSRSQSEHALLSSNEDALDEYTRGPILNVRLVNAFGGVGGGGESRRGRARRRAESTKGKGRGSVLDAEIGRTNELEIDGAASGSLDAAATPRPVVIAPTFEITGCTPDSPQMSSSISPSSPSALHPPVSTEFKIHDVGPISVAWGD